MANPDGSFVSDYATNLVVEDVTPPWRSEQEPTVDGVRQNDRITMRCLSPSNGGPAMRVELRAGDMTDTGGYIANRAEVYDEFPTTPASSTPWSKWPLAQNNAEHWFKVKVLLESGWTYDSTKWLNLVQFKGYRGGSPPFAIAVDGSKFKLTGRRNVFLGNATANMWHTIIVHARFAADSTGGIEVSMNGVTYLPWWQGQTMDVVNGAPDPIYFKQGIYRTSAWTVTHVAWFAPTTITIT